MPLKSRVIHWPLVWLVNVDNTPGGKLYFLTGGAFLLS